MHMDVGETRITLHNANTIYLLISNQHFTSFRDGFLFLAPSLGVFGFPRQADLTNCAPWHTSSVWDWINEGQKTTYEAGVWFPLHVRYHRSTCLSVFLLSVFLLFFFLLSPLVPLCIVPSIIVFSLAHNPLLISTSPFLKKNYIYSLSPRCLVSSTHTSAFHLVPHRSGEENTPKK